VLAVVLVWAAFAIGLYTSLAMWRHPDQPPPGWRLGSIPSAERVRALGMTLMVATGLLGLFGVWMTWSMIQYYAGG